MKTIMQPNSNVISLLKKQEYNCDLTYRTLNFLVIEKDKQENLYIFNNMTKGIYMLDKFESDAFFKIDTSNNAIIKLIESWTFVPDNFDEVKIFDQIRELYSKIRQKATNSYTNSFTILPTTMCNARCYYCYQQNCKTYTMDETIAHEVSTFISKKIHNNCAHLRWFGGEPLVANNIIDIICQDLNDKGISISSSIISNGYLFDDALVKKARDIWNLELAQITLDGTEKTYNKTKNYIADKVSTSAFEKVTNNIELLLKNNICVYIRINIAEKNEADVELLVKYLSKRYSNLKTLKTNEGLRLLNVYVHTLFQELPEWNNSISNTNLENRYSFELEMQKLIKEENLSNGYQLPMHIKASHCMADNGCSAVILPDGSITLCEHQVSGETNIGSIFNDDVDNDMILDWQKKYHNEDNCTTCPCYPSCIRLKNCPNVNKNCMPARQKWEISKLHNALKNIIKC